MVEGAEAETATAYGGSLTYYPSVIKQAIVLLGCAAFTAAIILLIAAGRIRGAYDVVMVALGLALFGAGGVFLLLRLLMGLAVRRPWLQLDGSGITSYAYPGGRHIPWADVAEIAIYRQRAAQGSRAYYLLVNVRDPERLPYTAARSFSVAFYPTMARAGIVVPLNMLFVRTSARKRSALLDRIAVQFAPELAAHGIVLDPVERRL